jgi:hypothetical protein
MDEAEDTPRDGDVLRPGDREEPTAVDARPPSGSAPTGADTGKPPPLLTLDSLDPAVAAFIRQRCEIRIDALRDELLNLAGQFDPDPEKQRANRRREQSLLHALDFYEFLITEE